MKRRLIAIFVLMIFSALLVLAGPHTIQKGETFADVAKLYNISLDTLVKANPGVEAYAGLTIEVPLSTLVYNVGGNALFRRICTGDTPNSKKGASIYKTAHEKQLKLNRVSEKQRQKLEAQILTDYEVAASYGNTDALYQLGRQKVHGELYSTEGYPSFKQSVNQNLAEFTKGIEILQIAALAGHNDKALVELAMACGYEKSPIYNPYLCIGMLEQYHKEFNLDVNSLICYMYENGYGILPNLLKAYVYCPSQELTYDNNSRKTYREKILEKIEAMPNNYETARYGCGLDSMLLMSIGLSHFHNGKMDEEGIFWLHRAARLKNADANWALASLLHNGNYPKEAMGASWNCEDQEVIFVRKAAREGHKDARKYLEAYVKQQKAKEERERLQALKAQQEREERKQRRRQMWTNIIGTVVQVAAQGYMAAETAKMQSYQGTTAMGYSMPGMSIGLMSGDPYISKSQLAMQQIAQYTVNKFYADWNGTPMIPTNMSAVNLGTDMTPGSPLWCWGMQTQINTMATQNARMELERVAFYRRQTDQITKQMMENPFQPIAGYVDIDGTWISREMIETDNVSSGNIGKTESKSRYDGFEKIIEKNKAYYAERYGYKDCDMCHRSRRCSSCNGKKYLYGDLGMNPIDCPNCLVINGKKTGLCRTCRGNGTVFGLK